MPVSTPATPRDSTVRPARRSGSRALTFLHITRQPVQSCAERLQSRWRLCGIARSGSPSIWGTTMRIALTTALMLMATMAFADEPSAPESKTEATTEAAPDNSAAQPAADRGDHGQGRHEATKSRSSRPQATRPKRIDGETGVVPEDGHSRLRNSRRKIVVPKRSCARWRARGRRCAKSSAGAAPARAAAAPQLTQRPTARAVAEA